MLKAAVRVKMATEMIIESLEYFHHSTRLNSESRRFTLDTSRGDLKTFMKL